MKKACPFKRNKVRRPKIKFGEKDSLSNALNITRENQKELMREMKEEIQ